MLAPALFFHLLSLVVLAGGLIGGTIVHAALKDSATASPANMMTFGRLSMRFGIASQIGALCMLASGLFLAASRQWVDMRQPWLHIKLTLFVLLALNGILVARRTGMKLGMTYMQNSSDPVIPSLLRRLSTFHAVQIVGFAAIIGLGVFGPR
jgi:uncharacterized membrane protein